MAQYEVPTCASNVGSRGNYGRDVLALSLTGCDPQQKWGPAAEAPATMRHRHETISDNATRLVASSGIGAVSPNNPISFIQMLSQLSARPTSA